MVLAGLHHFARASDHAGRGAAELQVVLADSFSVVHRVESGDFEDVDLGYFEDFCDFLHRRETQEVVVLLLSDEQHRQQRALLVVRWILREPFVHLLVVLRSEVEGDRVRVVRNFSVVDVYLRERTAQSRARTPLQRPCQPNEPPDSSRKHVLFRLLSRGL